MQHMHAAAAGYRAAVITSVGSYVFVLRLFLLLHGYGFRNAFELVNDMFSAKQGRVDSSQIPPCADCYCCLTRTP